MSASSEKLENVEFDHTLWLLELKFALKEMSIYENRILHLIAIREKEQTEPLGDLIMEFLEHRHVSNNLKKTIKKHIENMQNNINANGQLDKIINEGHDKVRARMEDYRAAYSALKDQFHRSIATS